MERKKRERKKVSIINDPMIAPYYISKDEYNYTIYESVINAKSIDKMVGHYTSLSELQLNLKPQYNSIQEYIKEYNEKYNKLNQILNIGV